MKKYIILPFFLMVIIFAQDPGNINWKEINTPHYRIIFPEEIYTDANRVANRMEYIYPKIGFYMQKDFPKIPIILSNRSVATNGYVSLCPRRTEWYSLPETGKSLYVGDWYNILSVHETRHIVQTTYANQGLTSVMKMFWGELGHGAGMAYIYPQWFLEGDAIMSETLLSESGRGRLASFQQGYRTIVLSGQHYKYKKARFGSYKNYLPDYYEMGYFMNTHVGRKYGYETWSKILRHSSYFWFLRPFSPINSGINRYTDYWSSKQLYKSTLSDLNKFWLADHVAIDYTKSQNALNQQPKYFTNYTYSHMINDEEFIFVKTGLATQTTLVRKNKNRVKKIIYLPAFSNYYGLDIRKNLVVWTQYSEDKRWNKESWSNLVVYNLKTRKNRQITTNGRYSNPAISTDETKIAAVEFTENRACNLVILSSQEGEILAKYSAPNNEMIHTPSWSPDDEKIVFTSTGFEGRAIYELNFNSGKMTKLTEYSRHNIFRPKYWTNFVLFESDESGIDNIFAINLNSGEKYQVTSVKFGAGYPSIYENTLMFSDYTAEGYRLMKMALDSTDFMPAEKMQKIDSQYFAPLLTEEFEPVKESNIPQQQYDYNDYKGLNRYFNYHSWTLMGNDNELGLKLFSDNLLETVSSNGYLLYDFNKETYQFGFNLSLLKFYPKIYLGLNHTERDETDGYIDIEDDYELEITRNWKELNFSVTSSIPIFRRNFGITTQLANIEIGTGYKRRYDKISKVSFSNINCTYHETDKSAIPVHFASTYYFVREKSNQAPVNNYGQISLDYNRTLYNPNMEGIQKYVGLFAGVNMGNKAGLTLNFQYEENINNGYSFESYISNTAIFEDIISRERIRYGFALKRHLGFPDVNFLYFLYIKRFIMNISFDTYNIDSYSNYMDFIDQNCATYVLGYGITTELGGIFDYAIDLPLTIMIYKNMTEGYAGLGISFDL